MLWLIGLVPCGCIALVDCSGAMWMRCACSLQWCHVDVALADCCGPMCTGPKAVALFCTVGGRLSVSGFYRKPIEDRRNAQRSCLGAARPNPPSTQQSTLPTHPAIALCCCKLGPNTLTLAAIGRTCIDKKVKSRKQQNRELL